MLLDPYNQTDHPECKSRPDGGLSAITELDPGYITGMLLENLVRLIYTETVSIVITKKMLLQNHSCGSYYS